MTKYVLNLSEYEVNVVLNALALRPYLEVAELIATIQKQAAGQDISAHAPGDAA